MARPRSFDDGKPKGEGGRRIFIEDSFVLGVDAIPLWALRNPRIELGMADGRARRAFVKTGVCTQIASLGDRIAVDKDGGLHVFSRPPLDAA